MRRWTEATRSRHSTPAACGRPSSAPGSPGVQLGRSSHRVRNPRNAPEPWLAELIDDLRQRPRQAHARRLTDLPDGGVGYAEPIFLGPECALCHGTQIDPPELQRAIRSAYPDDAATGFAPGRVPRRVLGALRSGLGAGASRVLSPSFDVEARLRALHGAVVREPGVLHVAAVWRTPGGGLRVLRIRPGTPRSETDFLVLNAARACADAVVTTGKILREEPEVSHALQGSPGAVEALARWRRDVLRRDRPACSAVLTSGRELDLDHPLLRSGHALLFVPEEAVDRLRADVGSREIEVVGSPSPDLRALVTWLREARGLRTISIEAGPSTALELYASPLGIDELWLSIFEGELDPELAGAEFPALAQIAHLLPEGAPGVRVDEPSGPWSFSRHARAAASGGGAPAPRRL